MYLGFCSCLEKGFNQFALFVVVENFVEQCFGRRALSEEGEGQFGQFRHRLLFQHGVAWFLRRYHGCVFSRKQLLLEVIKVAFDPDQRFDLRLKVLSDFSLCIGGRGAAHQAALGTGRLSRSSGPYDATRREWRRARRGWNDGAGGRRGQLCWAVAGTGRHPRTVGSVWTQRADRAGRRLGRTAVVTRRAVGGARVCDITGPTGR